MAMDINGLPGSANTGIKSKAADTQNATRSGDTASPQAGNSQAPESVTLSSEAQRLHQLERELADLPDSREELVEKLRGAISDGTYKPDNQKIAGKMLDMDALF